MNATDQFGLSCALVLPVDSDLTIDHRRLLAHADWCLDAGCSSLTVFGTTGEGASVSLTERRQILGTLSSIGIDPSRQIVGGVSATSIGDAVEQTRILTDAGCRRILLAPPFYFKGVKDEGLYQWFAQVCERVAHEELRVILYHIPSVTDVPLSIDLIDRLRTAFPELVVGVKDSGGDWTFTETLLVNHRDLTILIGDERHLCDGIRLGAKGSISGLANICPAVLLNLIDGGKADLRISALVTKILKYPVTPAVKVLVAHGRQDSRWLNVRPPLTQLSIEEQADLVMTYRTIFSTEGTQ
jgi:4-hydroxy-tetrahydrodipicolinate synthase